MWLYHPQMLNIHVCREDLYVYHLPGLVECWDLEGVPYLDLTLKQGVGHDGAHHTTPQHHSVAALPPEILDLPPFEQKCSKNVQFYVIWGKNFHFYHIVGCF